MPLCLLPALRSQGKRPPFLQSKDLRKYLWLPFLLHFLSSSGPSFVFLTLPSNPGSASSTHAWISCLDLLVQPGHVPLFSDCHQWTQFPQSSLFSNYAAPPPESLLSNFLLYLARNKVGKRKGSQELIWVKVFEIRTWWI